MPGLAKAQTVNQLLNCLWVLRQEVTAKHVDRARLAALDSLENLLTADPPDPRLLLIHQARTVAVPTLLEQGRLVETLQSWPGDDPDEALTRLAGIAAEEAHKVLNQRPERQLAYRNYCRRFNVPPLITEGRAA